MMTFAEPFRTVQDAIIERCEAQDLTVHPYMSLTPNLGEGYLFFNQPQPDQMRADQGEARMGLIVYSLHFYESFLNDPLVTAQRTSDVCARIFAAFQGATLGGKVRDARIDQMMIDPVQMAQGEKPAMMIDTTLHIRCASYEPPVVV